MYELYINGRDTVQHRHCFFVLRSIFPQSVFLQLAPQLLINVITCVNLIIGKRFDEAREAWLASPDM